MVRWKTRPNKIWGLDLLVPRIFHRLSRPAGWRISRRICLSATPPAINTTSTAFERSGDSENSLHLQYGFRCRVFVFSLHFADADTLWHIQAA